MKAFDAIVIGAGSVGLPTALFLAKAKLKVLVIDKLASWGQGQNKAAIGGVRATHSDPAKILLCKESLAIYSHWKEEYGDDIGYKKGGYCFPVFRKTEENLLKAILPIQKSFGLRIDWVDAQTITEIVPGISRDGLIGGTYSPDDAQVSPLLASYAIANAALALGTKFLFKQSVLRINLSGARISGVVTQSGVYEAPIVVVAAGAFAKEIGETIGLDLPVAPESHEGGISAPVEQFLQPLVVDLRPGPDGRSSNFYFGQNADGGIVFCYTPAEVFAGTDRRCTSEFGPRIARRLVSLIPRLKNLLVRRLWRGLYPMTPDGLPIVDAVREFEGLYLAVGMCGQGFMLGPGVGKNLASLITTGKPLVDGKAFSSLSLYRNFYAAKEALK